MEPSPLDLALVDFLLAVRAEYLGAGGNAMTHWTRIQEMARGAAATAETAAEWCTQVAKDLHLGAPSRDRSSATEALVLAAEGPEISDKVESEHAYLMALARLEAEGRKARKEETHCA